MSWYHEAVFYHIYPLGLLGCPKHNDQIETVHRIPLLVPWLDHIRELGFDALYIGPLFESEGHGYETTDYFKLDRRLGDNDDLKVFVKQCHERGIKVVLDGVFNHTGRSFFAFQDILQNRETSPYRHWYRNVDFGGNDSYNDGFSYANWGGHDLLVKLDQTQADVRGYFKEVVSFWINEFAIDGIRLDAADVLDFSFMAMLRQVTSSLKEDFWLMGEVIRGDYGRWANHEVLHSVTNYALYKALYNSHNEHNYFELAHTLKYTTERLADDIRLYNFTDNHDVERISSRLRNKAHYLPVHILLYTLPGIPSIYYGSEFGIEGKKQRYSDDSLRPCIDLAEHANDLTENPCTSLIAALGKIHSTYREIFAYGDYRELVLSTTAYAFAHGPLIIAVNNATEPQNISLTADQAAYRDLLSDSVYHQADGRLSITLPSCGGAILVPENLAELEVKPLLKFPQQPEKKTETPKEVAVPAIPLEQMSVEQLQAFILQKMANNGPVTEQMKKDVYDNIWKDSLLNWAKSFR